LNRKRLLWLFLPVGGAILVLVFSNCVGFGRLPQGERLERIKQSPNYRDGQFVNLDPPVSAPPPEPGAPRRSRLGSLLKFIFGRGEGVVPENPVPTRKTSLPDQDREENILVWMGHSSCFIQTEGLRFLIDPVLVMASPVFFANRPFKGSDVYKPEDLPEIDYLIITHDHWDHLDYDTVKSLKNRYKKIICGLGVGEHFEYWGFDLDSIIELDWNETADLGEGVKIHCLPARHFSGRGLKNRNKTLWASYMLQTPERTIFISGDGGYGTHFAEIGKRFPRIDLALMENGQYNLNWSTNHLMPADLVRAVKELHPEKLVTVHNSKYALSDHRWNDPLAHISRADEEESLHLLTPMIGEVVFLDDPDQVFTKWWEIP